VKKRGPKAARRKGTLIRRVGGEERAPGDFLTAGGDGECRGKQWSDAWAPASAEGDADNVRAGDAGDFGQGGEQSPFPSERSADDVGQYKTHHDDDDSADDSYRVLERGQG
jgi:hypothetical protein